MIVRNDECVGIDAMYLLDMYADGSESVRGMIVKEAVGIAQAPSNAMCEIEFSDGAYLVHLSWLTKE